MTYRPLPLAAAILATIVVAVASTPACAQYAWLDDKGVRQYSDQPPPPSVPTSRILTLTGGMVEPASGAAATGEADAPPVAAAPMSLAEKNAAFRKRRAEQAEREKKAAQQAKIKAEKAKNCERTRVYHETLASGQRVATTDKNGERVFLTDEQRAQELRDTTHALSQCK